MERISWMERRTNDEIHEMVDEKRSLIRVTRSRQRNCLGHILRGDSILRTIIEGRMEGKKKRGRLRIIHSGHFYSAPTSPPLLRGAPDYSTDTVLEFHAEAHRQL